MSEMEHIDQPQIQTIKNVIFDCSLLKALFDKTVGMCATKVPIAFLDIETILMNELLNEFSKEHSNTDIYNCGLEELISQELLNYFYSEMLKIKNYLLEVITHSLKGTILIEANVHQGYTLVVRTVCYNLIKT